jgi:DNA polymerase-3 subunit delta'
MEQGAHPDFRKLEPPAPPELDMGEEEGGKRAGQQITVDQVRLLSDFVNVSSHRGMRKVVLIHPAEALNVNAANALLKSLEEPPPETCFLLVSHRWHQLLPTIRSRCQIVVLPLPPASEARQWLKEQGMESPELALAQAGGAPLLALRYDETYWRTRRAFFEEIAQTRINPLAAAERLRDVASALALEWMQKWSFDLACCQHTGRVRYNPDFAEAIGRTAARLDVVETVRFHRYMVGLQRVVAHPLNARLFLEELLLSYAALLQGSRQLVA